MRALTLLLSSVLVVHALEEAERDRLNDELPRAVQELSDAHDRLSEAAQQAGIAVPAPVKATLVARRTQESEWEKRLADPAAKIEAEEVDHFREQIDGLRGRFEEVTNVVETLGQAAERWPHCAESPELKQFQTFMRTRIDHSLAEIAAGSDVAGEDDAAQRQQRRHEVLLQTVEADQQAAERWRQVPPDTQALHEYHDQRRALRALAERGLAQPSLQDQQELDRGEAILNLLDEIVQLVQSREEHLAGHDAAGSPLVVTAVAACLGGEEQALRALIVHQRVPTTDERAWNQAEEQLRRERDHRARFTGMAWEWFDQVASLPELRQNFDQRLADAPAPIKTEAQGRWNALDSERTTCETALNKALQERARVAAVQAKGELALVRRGYDALVEDVELHLAQDSEEREWRMHTKLPGVAAALARLDASNAALTKARNEQRTLERAAVQAQIARELAEAAAEEAQQAADQARNEADRLREDLEQRRQQVRDVLENPEPKPDGDAKF